MTKKPPDNYGLQLDPGATQQQIEEADIVMSWPMEDDAETDAAKLLPGFVSNAEKAEARMDLLERLTNAGLDFAATKSADADEVFLIISASQERLMEAAEFAQMELRLKAAWEAPWAPFTIRQKKDFVWEDEARNILFCSRDRQVLLMNVLESGDFKTAKDMKLKEHVKQDWFQTHGTAKHATCGLNLDKMQSKGFITGYWAMHGEGSGAGGGDNRRNLLIDDWANFKKSFSTQPLDVIFQYFNSKIALYFAFAGFYSWWLVQATVAGFATQIIGWIMIKGGNLVANDAVKESDKSAQSHAAEMSVTLFCFYMALWGTLFLEMWKRYNAELAYR